MKQFQLYILFFFCFSLGFSQTQQEKLEERKAQIQKEISFELSYSDAIIKLIQKKTNSEITFFPTIIREFEDDDEPMYYGGKA